MVTYNSLNSSSFCWFSRKLSSRYLYVIGCLKEAIEVSKDAPDRVKLQIQTREKIQAFAARYQRNKSISNLSSSTIMRTALSSLAGHYSSCRNRPVREKLRKRLEQQFSRVESAVQGSL